LVASQGGDIEVVKDMDLLPKATLTYEYKSKSAGYISHLSAMDIGLASVKLGAGRETKESPIDHSAGIVLSQESRYSGKCRRYFGNFTCKQCRFF
jgi:pyrimidine-nucleoside phosphorylase